MTTRRETLEASEQLVDKLFKQFTPTPESPTWKLSESERQRSRDAITVARGAMVAAFMDYAERVGIVTPDPTAPEV